MIIGVSNESLTYWYGVHWPCQCMQQHGCCAPKFRNFWFWEVFLTF